MSVSNGASSGFEVDTEKDAAEAAAMLVNWVNLWLGPTLDLVTADLPRLKEVKHAYYNT